eukprot:jgi/Chlat1/485/Chrsp103S00983
MASAPRSTAADCVCTCSTSVAGASGRVSRHLPRQRRNAAAVVASVSGSARRAARLFYASSHKQRQPARRARRCMVVADGAASDEEEPEGFSKPYLWKRSLTGKLKKQPPVDELAPSTIGGGEGGVLLLACAVGVLSGVGVVLFNYGVHSIQHIAWEDVPLSRGLDQFEAWPTIVGVPVLGGIAVGLLRYIAVNFEVEEVAKLPKWAAGGRASNALPVGVRRLMKTVAATVTLGTGNSLGPEGPSVEIGQNVAAMFGSALQGSRERRRSLQAAGAAAGLSAGFNAPIAGVFFAVESKLWSASSQDSAPSLTMAMVLLSSVLAAVVTQAGLGTEPAFSLPSYELLSLGELPLYMLLGAVCGGLATVFSRFSQTATSTFAQVESAGVPRALHPSLGGLFVGIVALVWPEVLYQGFKNFNFILKAGAATFTPPLLVQIVVLKLVTTAISKGSGLVGGVYAPSLFIGAAVGVAYGELAALSVATFATYAAAHGVPPGLISGVVTVAAPQAYALVGMAATLAAVCRVPLTSVLLLFELTRDYTIILPLMAAVGIAYLVAPTPETKQLRKESIQSEGDAIAELRTKRESAIASVGGLIRDNLRPGTPWPEEDFIFKEDLIRERQLMKTLTVSSAMTIDVLRVDGNMPIHEAASSMLKDRRRLAMVCDHEGLALGLITLDDVLRNSIVNTKYQQGPLCLNKKVVDICTPQRNLIVVYPDTPLAVAWENLKLRGVHQLPVVTHNNRRKVVGILNQECVSMACMFELARQALMYEYDTVNGEELPASNDARTVEVASVQNNVVAASTLPRIAHATAAPIEITALSSLEG